MNNNIQMSIIMPAYNEEEHIYNNLIQVVKIVSVFCNAFEIICVNDGSNDNTEKEIFRAKEECKNIKCISYNNNVGKGYAIRTGVNSASGEFIAFLDSDLDLSPVHLNDFMVEMIKQNADIVIGSKMHPESVLDYPLSRKIVSIGYYIFLRTLFHMKVHDTQTGIKLFRKDILKKIIGHVETEGFAYDIEILALANKLGAKIIERPVTIHFARTRGFARIKIKDIVAVFNDTLKIKKRILRFKIDSEKTY